MQELELISFEIISNVGVARSKYIDAIRLAREGNYKEAETSIAEGDKSFTDGHNAHMKLLQADTEGKVGLLVIHAEDQLMSAESFKILASEFIEIYKKVN